MDRKTVIAAGFMAAAILVSIPLGANRSFGRLREDASDSYYYDSTGYAIYEGLDARQEAAENLLTLARKYEGTYPELRAAIDELDYQVKLAENYFGVEEVTEEIEVNESMGEAAKALAEQLESLALSEKDEKYPRQLMADMDAEQDKLKRSSYNDDARSFNAKLDAFPLGVPGIEKLGVFE